MGDLQAEGLAPGTINNHIKDVKTLFRVNGLTLVLPYRLPKYVKHNNRALTPEELSGVIEIATVKEKNDNQHLNPQRNKNRNSSQTNLYGHVRKNFEAGIVSIHVHVEKEITKGKYQDYDMFIGAEAVEALKTY